MNLNFSFLNLGGILEAAKKVGENIIQYTVEGTTLSVINNYVKKYLKYELDYGQTITSKNSIEIHGTKEYPWIELDEYTFNEYLLNSPFSLLSFKLKRLVIPIFSTLSQFKAEDVVIILSTNKKVITEDFMFKEKQNKKNGESEGEMSSSSNSYQIYISENSENDSHSNNNSSSIDGINFTNQQAKPENSTLKLEEAFTAIKDLLISIISILQVNIKNFKVFLHDQDNLYEFIIDLCTLEKSDKELIGNQISKYITFENIVISKMVNRKFSEILNKPNPKKEDSRFFELTEFISKQQIEKKKMFSYINGKKNSDRVQIDFLGKENIDLKVKKISKLEKKKKITKN